MYEGQECLLPVGVGVSTSEFLLEFHLILPSRSQRFHSLEFLQVLCFQLKKEDIEEEERRGRRRRSWRQMRRLKLEAGAEAELEPGVGVGRV
jgi:hypothetical protein